MASVQERLQLKRLPLDKWSISEKLYLASAVAACSGDQNWMSVSRSLKIMCGSNRPSDWFSQKSCAAQYGNLLENVETPKRKKRNENASVETPGESILRKLTQERLAELNKCIQDEREEYAKIKEEILAIQNGVVDEKQLREMWAEIETEEKQREKEQQKHAQWLKEREERKREMERSWRPHYQQGSPAQSPSKASSINLKVKLEEMEVDDPNSRQGTSPLLTSLLKSPSPAPNPSVPSMHHTAMNVSVTQTRVAAPTITNLLTGSTTILTQQTTPKPIVASAVTSIPIPFSAQLQTQPLTGPAPSDQSSGNVPQSPSQSAPTLSMLLENKNKESVAKAPTLVHIDQTPTKPSDAGNKTTTSDQETNAADSPIKDEDQQLMEDFNGLIPDNIDELANILNENNAIILNPELLEEESILDNVDELIGDADNASDAVEMDPAGDAIAEESTDIQMPDMEDNKFEIASMAKSDVPPATDAEKAPKSIEEQNVVDEEIVNVKTEDSIAMAKQDEDSSHSTLVELEKISSVSKEDDDSSSDLSNDTPLSELIKQDSSAKAELQQKAAEAAAAAATSAKMEQEEPDTIESDSNDDQCLGSLKREIQGLSPLKEIESSETPQQSVETTNQEVKSEDEVEIEPANGSEKKEEIGTDVEATESIELKQEDDQIIELSSNEADQVQEKDVEEANTEDDVNDTEIKDSEIQAEIVEIPSAAAAEEDDASNGPVSHPVDVTSPGNCPINIANDNSEEEGIDESTESEVKKEVETAATTTDEHTVDDNVIEEIAIGDDDVDEHITDETKECDTEPAADVDAAESMKIEDKGSVESVEIVEIKDDDDKSESQIIVIEEADDLIIEDSVGATDSEKNDECNENEQSQKDEISTVDEQKDEQITKPESKRKTSTDDELFEDAKENMDDVKSDDMPPNTDTENAQQPIMIIDTDDDMPMEVIKEDKVGRAKRDYSRRNKESTQSIDKRSEETTSSDDVVSTISSRLRLKERERSESPYVEEDSGEPTAKSKRRYSSTPNIDSLPNSPASSDDREYRGWKKSILLVYNSLNTHRYASLFSKPITEDQAPNYKTIVFHPMDLQTLKRNIDSGHIRTTLEFQRYVMLMCHNAMFYNINDNVISARAKEILTYALSLIEDIMDTWKKENEKAITAASTSSASTSAATKVVRGRKSNRLMN